jgi:hypothetical protein
MVINVRGVRSWNGVVAMVLHLVLSSSQHGRMVRKDGTWDSITRPRDVVAASEYKGRIMQAIVERVLMLGNNLLNAQATPLFYADSI